MAQITIGGTPTNTLGSLPLVGEKAPNFRLTRVDLSDATLADFSGKKSILNIFPSIDTPICSASVKRFNQEASALANTEVL